jgi:nucleolin
VEEKPAAKANGVKTKAAAKADSSDSESDSDSDSSASEAEKPVAAKADVSTLHTFALSCH